MSSWWWWWWWLQYSVTNIDKPKFVVAISTVKRYPLTVWHLQMSESKQAFLAKGMIDISWGSEPGIVTPTPKCGLSWPVTPEKFEACELLPSISVQLGRLITFENGLHCGCTSSRQHASGPCVSHDAPDRSSDNDVPHSRGYLNSITFAGSPPAGETSTHQKAPTQVPRVQKET